ncbi:patatin-like phospholipase family protein [Pseudorhodoferax soli]|uniref:Patatin-like phospholipase n=1 Tax=Pseudorhodoferax soli TaxID=545864 RepID=A0A368XN58_9BURK|nr:patatin-like phospholipase family protein [Pseudorhodoferax soli]RCW69442.1 patatin-like phospholipase [Pseudorhodoferax soli]
MYKYGVFQGGGVKGVALVGALEVAESRGVSFEGVGGASAGAIVAALYAAGYTAAEMRSILEGVQFDSLLDGASLVRLALAKRLGLYRGKLFQEWIHKHLARKGVRFFNDCPKQLRIVATNLTERTLVVLDTASQPTLEVAEAVRMSMSIPFVFEPVQLGRNLMVDGGVLSNFPLSLFDGNATLGFRLHSRSASLPFAPEGYREYLVAIMGAMLDGRDNYDVQTKKLAGLIEIDPGRFSSTQFKLSVSEKADLYERGVSAANRFFVDPVNMDRTQQLTVRGTESTIGLKNPAEVGDEAEIRFSISALVRIEVDGHFLLTKGNRIEQFQPVGGVLKTFSTAHGKLGNLGVKADSKIPIDQDSRDDLRVFVPRRSIEAFIQWYLEGRGRETSPWREFNEELVETGVLSSENFRAPAFDYVGRRVEGIRWTQHFQCYEVLIAEVFALVPTLRQIEELNALRGHIDTPGVMWASPALIRALGYDAASQRQLTRISEHSSWILDAGVS